MELLSLTSVLNLTSHHNNDTWSSNASLAMADQSGPFYPGVGDSSSEQEDAPRARRPAQPYGLPPGYDDPIVVLFQAISTQLQMYGTPTYCGLGLLGNLLSGLVLLNSDIWKLSAARYLLALLIADVAYLVNLLIGWLSDVQGVGIYTHGGLCHFTTFLSHGSCFLSLWYLVCFTVDGYIRICFRRRQEAMCTPTRANVVILAFVAVAIAVFINISITFGVTAGPVPRCAPLNMFLLTLQTLFKIDIFLNSMLPDVAILYILFHSMLVCLSDCSRDESSRPSVKHRCCGCCCYCCIKSPSTAGVASSRVGGDLRLTQERTDPALETDFRRLYFVYILVATCLNLSSHMPRIYYTIHGFLYPHRPLTMKDFVWQQLLIHAYYVRCTINFFIFFCASKNFRRVSCSGITSLKACLTRMRQRRNPSGHLEGGAHPSGNEDDETVTALMKDGTSSTTPV